MKQHPLSSRTTFSDAVGSLKHKGVSHSLFEVTALTFPRIAALEEEDRTGQPIDRYRVDIDRALRTIEAPTRMALSQAELKEVALTARGHR